MTTWIHALERAASRKAVTDLVNEYLATWTPAEISRLPESCRPGRMHGVEDILHWDVILAEAYCAGAVHGPDNETYGRILAFISAAAERARAIEAEDPDESAAFEDETVAGTPPEDR